MWGGGHAGYVMSPNLVNFQICIFVQRDPPLLIYFSSAHCSAFFHSLQNAQPKLSSRLASQAVLFHETMKQIKRINNLDILLIIIVFQCKSLHLVFAGA